MVYRKQAKMGGGSWYAVKNCLLARFGSCDEVEVLGKITMHPFQCLIKTIPNQGRCRTSSA